MFLGHDTTGAGRGELGVLRGLARRGAYLTQRQPEDRQDPHYALIFPSQGREAVARTVAEDLVLRVQACGWLEERDGYLKLSRAGALVLRQQKSAAGSPEGPAKPPNVRQQANRTDNRPSFNDAESPLAWLRRRKDKSGRSLLSQAEFDAGERLRADFWYAQMTPRVTADWSPSTSSRRSRRSAPGSVAEMSDAVLAAKLRVERALSAVGPELSGVLIDVCCHLRGLEEVERAVGWPLRSAKVVLSMALSALARHYGIVASATDRDDAHGRIRRWGSHDYRPSLSDDR
jgi:hypothetical protein